MCCHSVDLNIKGGDTSNSSNEVSVAVHAILSIPMSRAFCKKCLKIDSNSFMPTEIYEAQFFYEEETEAQIEQTSKVSEK